MTVYTKRGLIEMGGGMCHHSSPVGIKTTTMTGIQMKPKYSHRCPSIDILVTWYLMYVFGVGCVHTHKCRPKLDIRNLSQLFFIYWHRVSHRTSGSPSPACLASPSFLQVSAVSLPLMLELQVGCSGYPACTWVLGLWIPIFTFTQQALLSPEPTWSLF